MHPGPVNRGVELSPEVIDSPQSLISAQVESGLVVRMAILYELLTGSDRPAPTGARAGDAPPRIGAAGVSRGRSSASARLSRRGGRRPGHPRRARLRPPRGARRRPRPGRQRRRDRRDRRAGRADARRRRGGRGRGPAGAARLRRSPRPLPRPRPGAQGGPGDRHARRRRRRLLRGDGDGEHRAAGRLGLGARLRPRQAERVASIPVGFVANVTRGMAGEELTEMAELARRRRGRASPTTACRSAAPASCAGRSSTSGSPAE